MALTNPNNNPLNTFAERTGDVDVSIQEMPRIPDYIRNFHSAPEWKAAWDKYDQEMDRWRKNLSVYNQKQSESKTPA